MAESPSEKYMRRCLDLAQNAEGMTSPNPLVGSVVVYKDRIIGEGYHIKAGGPHAEVLAINSVKEKEYLPESTLYVSLEPCCHHGKTPPCTDLILEKGIPRIVIGTMDTSINVGGRGINILKEAGREVITGVLEKESRFINRRFFTFHEKKRPYIILKWAQSSDGFIDVVRHPGDPAGPRWISGKAEQVLVHRWRASEEAILVGARTVRNDKPSLTTRLWPGKNLLRLVISSSGKDLAGFAAGKSDSGQVIVFTGKTAEKQENVNQVILEDESGAGQEITEFLYRHGLQSLIVEGGAVVLNHFISTGLWDEARIFRGKKPFHQGVKAPQVTGKLLNSSEFASSVLETLLNEGA